MSDKELIERLEKLEERNKSLENTIVKIDTAIANLAQGILSENKTSILSILMDIGNMVAVIGKFK